MPRSDCRVRVPVDGRIPIERLRQLAVEFDSISAEQGYRATASEFTEWLQREHSAQRIIGALMSEANARAGTPRTRPFCTFVFGVRAGNRHLQDISPAHEIVESISDLVGRF